MLSLLRALRRALAWLIRTSHRSGDKDEDAWLKNWHGEGLKRRRAVRRKGRYDKGKNRVSDSFDSVNQVEKDIYTGRRTSVGSMEREEMQDFFETHEGCQNPDDVETAMANIRKMRRHFGR
ncbi:hypothetical protein ACLMJK_007520 [Lecanora helva]